jgi:short-subunit dehydrogenase
MSKRKVVVDKQRFGPWALVTGASSGVGAEFARQLAADGLNVALAARRVDRLARLGAELERDFGVAWRKIQVNLSEEGFLDALEAGTRDLDVGLVVSNAGAVTFGHLLESEPEALERRFRLNAWAHLALVRRYGPALARRKRGGFLLVSSMAGLQGVPFVADYAAAKAFVLTLGEGLHAEFAGSGVAVSVLLPGAVDTEMISSIGLDRNKLPTKPMSATQCVAEGLSALAGGRATHIPGRLNRIMTALLPRTTATRMNGEMMARGVGRPELLRGG